MKSFDLKNPRNAYAFMLVLLTLAGLYMGWDYYYVPKTNEINRLEGERETKQQELDKIHIQKKRIVLLEKDLKSAEKEFARLREMFPEEEKVPLRLQDLYTVVRSSGVQIMKFTPDGRVEKDYFIENKYSLAVNSGYHMLGTLFAEIANFNYPTSINDLKIGRYSGIETEVKKAEDHGSTPITTSVTFSLTTYTSRNLGK